MTMTSTFKITAIGDLHFGNPKLKAEELYAKLFKHLYPELADTQLLLLTGDTYDQLTTVNSSANRYVLKFIQDRYVYYMVHILMIEIKYRYLIT